MANDLIVIEKMEAKLRERRPAKDNVFPLSPTHRKELRKLRNENISGLRGRIRDIRKIKQQEFYDKHKLRIEKEADKLIPIIGELNKKYEEHLSMIQKSIDSMKSLESSFDMTLVSVSFDYGDIPNLRDINEIETKRVYRRDDQAIKATLEKLFRERFQERFNEVEKQISLMLTQYEEAINFGDLEVVKELYYGLKDAESFVDKVSKIKV